MCGVARAPVLRALAGTSGAASLAKALELEIGEERLRLAGLGDRLNERKKIKPKPLTRTGRSYCVCPCHSFGPAAH